MYLASLNTLKLTLLLGQSKRDLKLLFQGTSFPVWIFYRHYLDDPWSFFSKPWCQRP
jgi:hypothetical protein